jgi:hypothetical protein
LDVVNDMLGTLGEAPLNDLASGHPLVGAATRILDTANSREQAKSWWFNKELVKLSPDVSGYIYLPNDTIRVDPQATTLHYVQRGRRLYQPYASASIDKYKFTRAVTCWLVRLIPFEDIPVPAQLLVSYSAQVDFMKSYDADPNKYAEVKNLRDEARIVLNAEHTLNQNSNLLRMAMRPGYRSQQSPYGDME